MGIKDKLLDVIQRGKEQEEAFIRSLSEAERQAQGTFQDWSAKDLLGHITAWKTRQADRVEHALRGEQPDSAEDFEHENSVIYDAMYGKSFAEVQQVSQQTWARLIAGIQALSDEDLTDRQRFPWTNGQPLWRQIVSNSYTHPSIHLAEHHTKLGRPEIGLKLQVQSATVLGGLDESPDWQGTLIYNLACYYAINGQREKALDSLRQSLQMNPNLVEWSKQDSDLNSLRSDPEYLALYQ
jgi:hypothetical protein